MNLSEFKAMLETLCAEQRQHADHIRSADYNPAESGNYDDAHNDGVVLGVYYGYQHVLELLEDVKE